MFWVDEMFDDIGKRFNQVNKTLVRQRSRFALGLVTFILVIGIAPVSANTNFHHLIFAQSGQEHSKLSTQNAKAFLDQGRIRFEAGRFAEAADVWNSAAANFERQGDTLNQAWSLSYVSLAYQNLGEWKKAQTAIDTSLKILRGSSSKQSVNAAVLAVILNTQGNLKISTGQPEAALKIWQEAEQAYLEAKDTAGVIGTQINQAQALQAMGLYRRAKNLLTDINDKLQKEQDSPLKLKALRSLGVTLQVVGELDKSERTLKESLEISKKLGLVGDSSEILFSLGNTKRSLEETQQALDYYQQAAAIAANPRVKVEAELNQLSLYVAASQSDYARVLIPEIKSQLENLPASRMSVYAAVNFAQSLSLLAQTDKAESGRYQDAAKILARALQDAEKLGDSRAKAYSLTELGKLYEYSQQPTEALKLSQQALSIAQSINASDITYQAAWQLGRIYKNKGNKEGALAAYASSVGILKSLRSDLVAVNSDIQFSFQESVEPVYREYVSLLLQSNPSQQNLRDARATIEALQLAELDNFFREACIDAKKEIDEIDQQAAVVYPIILPDRLEVILSMPGGDALSNYRTSLSEAEVEKAIKLMRQSLNPAFSNQERLQVSQQLYNWLIRPVESALSHRGIKTLVFVLDGSLRNLPMAGLHDGKHYLIEKYNIALSPGLQIMQSQSNINRRLKVIAAGLSQANQGFKALPSVESEVTQISSKLSSKLLLNQNFTDKKLKSVIKNTPFSVLHLATHGQFSSKSDDTFIVTWNGKINVKQLDELLETRIDSESTPVELIVLSACQTAKGDNRAILGLAGVAVRSGARSTLATLWAVQDDSTAKFMVEFYKQLRQPGVSKAQALRNAQLTFLQDSNQDFQHPFYWAPFVLIGNWL